MLLVALAWAPGCWAQPAESASPATVGDPTLRLSRSLARIPAPLQEPTDVQPQDATVPSYSERTRQPVQVLQAAREQRERELLEALDTARRQQQSTADLERRLAHVRSQRYANPVVYTLAALLAAAVAGVTLMWRRARAGSQGAESPRSAAGQDGAVPAR